MNSMSSPKSESREKSAASGKHKPVPGARPPELGELVRCEDRISFVYFGKTMQLQSRTTQERFMCRRPH